MVRWLFNWLILSVLLIVGALTALSLWPQVILRLGSAADLKGTLALTMLAVVSLGFLKLAFGPTRSATPQ